MPESIEVVTDGDKGPECHVTRLPECLESGIIDVERICSPYRTRESIACAGQEHLSARSDHSALCAYAHDFAIQHLRAARRALRLWSNSVKLHNHGEVRRH